METHAAIDLERLSETERKTLYSQLAFEFDPQATKATLTGDEALVWGAINETVKIPRSFASTLTKAGKSYTRARFTEEVEFVMGWLDRGCSRPVNRHQRRALVQLAVGLLGRRLTQGPAGLSHKTMLQQLEKVPSCVDRAFPGYQDAQMLDRLAMLTA